MVLRLTPTLLRIFLDRGITFKRGRTEGSIFIKFKGGEFRIHKSNKVFENENRGVAKYRYIFYCKVRKNGNTLCRARITIFQTIPEHIEGPQVMFEGAHLGVCSSLKPVKRRRRKKKKKKKKERTRMEDEDEDVGEVKDYNKDRPTEMEDDSLLDNEIVESGGMEYGSDEQRFFQNNKGRNMDNNSSVPSTDQYPPFNISNNIMGQPSSQLQQRKPMLLQEKRPQQQRIERLPSMEDPHSPLMEDEGRFTFGLDVDDFSIYSSDISGTGDSLPPAIPFPYAGGSSWYRHDTSAHNSPPNTPPFSVLGSTPGSPTHPPPPPPSRLGREETPPLSGMMNEYNTDFGSGNNMVCSHQMPPPHQQQIQRHNQMEDSNVKAVVPAEGPSTGGTLIRVFCNLGTNSGNTNGNDGRITPSRVEVKFGRKQAQVVAVLPSESLQRESLSHSAWESADTVILVISPSSGNKERVDLVVSQPNNNYNSDNGNRKIRAFRYYTFSQSFSTLFDQDIMDPTFDLNGYCGT